ncbi:hypothetical protein MUK42_07800 [Musa troglodytarum]|uniref:Uncharacterized protein n=1 Tax=Musa troglodytarum TaxID=320322 RepID=A0A9E7FCD8_9LILI|nr:hypothetical protein MUK42_07800 [Musa troglodytarum]
MKRKGNALQNPAVMAVVRGGSYDSASVGIKASALVTPDRISSLISNLNLLDQIGSFELNHISAHSQRLNGDAIVAFVRALCKVFTIAAADERKNIVPLAFGTMEKIVRDCFPYITETETTTLLNHEFINDDEEEANMETASYAIVRMKNHTSVQLQIVQHVGVYSDSIQVIAAQGKLL